MNTRRRYTNRKKPGNRMNRIMRIGLAGLVLLTVLLAVRGLLSAGGFFGSSGYGRVDVDASEPEIDVQLLDVNPYSRPGTQSSGITGIVIHYTANPGSSAQDNRDYFNGLQDSHETQAEQQFCGRTGRGDHPVRFPPGKWRMRPMTAIMTAYTIEVCHPDETGRFTKKSYESLVQLTAWLCVKFRSDGGRRDPAL